MKRLIAILLLMTLLLCGCGGEPEEGTVVFYYLRKDVTFGSQDSVIVPEEREIHTEDPMLPDLLFLYMTGPVSELLRLPFSGDIRVTDIRQEGSTLTVVFNPEFSRLDGMDLTLACACISRTCFSVTDAQIVRIEAPAEAYGSPISFTTTRDTFLLFDDATTPPDADDAS